MSRQSLHELSVLLAPALVFVVLFTPRPPTPADREVARLRAHFATVERELLARDISGLTDAQRAARDRHIARLRTYAREGVFPKNTDFPGRQVPYFVDRYGTRCAMAHLIEQAGQAHYVRRVAAKMNNATIAEIARDPELGRTLLAWLNANGLTVEEAGRIQPMYGCGGLWVGPNPPPCPPRFVVDEPDAVATNYLLGTGMAMIAGVSSLMLNPTESAGWLGVGAGVAGLALGGAHLGDRGASQALGLANLGLGVASTYVGMRRLLRRPAKPPPTFASATVGPWVTRGGGGLTVNVQF